MNKNRVGENLPYSIAYANAYGSTIFPATAQAAADLGEARINIAYQALAGFASAIL